MIFERVAERKQGNVHIAVRNEREISKKCLNLSAMFILKYKFESWHHHFSLIKCEFLIFSSRLRNNCEISFFPFVSSPLLSNKKAINCK